MSQDSNGPIAAGAGASSAAVEPTGDAAPKTPSELSLDLFKARCLADDTLPASVTKAIKEHDEAGPTALLAALQKAIESSTS